VWTMRRLCRSLPTNGIFPQSESAVGNAADEALKIEYLAGL
jgi:hypothetical protein